MKTLMKAGVALAISAGHAAAQDVIELDEITAVASLEEVPIARTGATVTVIDAEALDLLGETRLTDVLDRVAGVEVRTDGPLGARSGVQIRGASQNYVPVYIDGIEVTDPSNPQVAADFGTLSVADVRRIEVLRGSQSALYGSEAVGGVILIQTLDPETAGDRGTVTAEVGTYGTAKLALGTSRVRAGDALAVGLSHLRSDGFSAADENAGNDEADGYRSTRLTLSGHRDTDGGVRVGGSAFVQDSAGEFDGFDAVTFLPADGPGENESLSFGARAFAEWTAGGIDSLVEASRVAFDRENRDSFGAYRFEGARSRIAYLGGTDIAADLRLAFGAEATREEAATTSSFETFARSSTTLGVFGETTWSPGEALDLSLALRHDRHSAFGGATTGRVAAAWRAAPGWTIRGAAGTGYRAPSLYELYSQYGDADLDPERSLSVDLGVERELAGGAVLRATAFYLEVDDLIDFDFSATGCASSFGCYAQIDGSSRRHGVEIEGYLPVGPATELGFSYTNTESASSASSAWGAVPRHAFGVSVDHRLGDRLTASLRLARAAGRRNGLDDYTVADAALTWRASETADIYLRVENLFDEEYQLTPGYGTSDRAIYAGLRASF